MSESDHTEQSDHSELSSSGGLDAADAETLAEMTELTVGASRLLLQRASGSLSGAVDAFFGGEVDRVELELVAGSGKVPACQFFWNGYCRNGDACPLRHASAATRADDGRQPAEVESVFTPSPAPAPAPAPAPRLDTAAPALFTRDTSTMTYEELLALGEQIGVVKTPVAPVVRSCLHAYTFRGNDKEDDTVTTDDACTVCTDTYEEGDHVTALPCRHAFHTSCIHPWMDATKYCPNCKAEITV